MARIVASARVSPQLPVNMEGSLIIETMRHSRAEEWVVPFNGEPGSPLDLDEGKSNNSP